MKLSIRSTTNLLSGKFGLFRRLSYTATPPQQWPENPTKINKVELCRKLSEVGSTGQKVTDVLHNLTANGFKLDYADLVFCLKRLRKYHRYNHCLEILEWMEKGSVNFRDHALRLNLIFNLKGIDEAESYFFALPPEAKKPFIYGTMLNCYCINKMPVKALALFRKMEEMNCVSSSLIFDNLMSLYMKVGQPEKVHPLVQEMKQRNIPLSNVSYYILLQSCGQLKDLAGLEQVMEEVERHSFLKNDWKIYSTLATAYINLGQTEKAVSTLRNLEGFLDYSYSFDRTAYHHLISLFARTGNKDSVFQAWGKLKSRFIGCHNKSYLIMLQTLSKLDDIEGLKMVLAEWESRYKSYDIRLPNVVIHAYLMHGMLEAAELLFKDTISRNVGQNLWYPHICFMDYYLERKQFDSALMHMEAAYSNGWKLCSDKLGSLFEHFVQKQDTCGAEKLCNMLKNVQALDSKSYLWLLQTYVAAGKEISGLRQRMEEDGINISFEHEELLSKIDRR
ncbi:pentatricopeptide repeat-containing protein At4g01990, mitochondrial-like [Silene latifolia]|uniref:pentatricopeptide repeat-containing protein At4g01990, mitochondrial-like n=1 Tax=Silene latifolia TaxID=37657 RepID=UPI003D779AA7